MFADETFGKLLNERLHTLHIRAVHLVDAFVGKEVFAELLRSASTKDFKLLFRKLDSARRHFFARVHHAFSFSIALRCVSMQLLEKLCLHLADAHLFEHLLSIIRGLGREAYILKT